jgi:hypothetical protein
MTFLNKQEYHGQPYMLKQTEGQKNRYEDVCLLRQLVPPNGNATAARWRVWELVLQQVFSGSTEGAREAALESKIGGTTNES